MLAANNLDSVPAGFAKGDVGSARRADVVVIGAGAVGVAAALELAERGASVTVLERGPGPAAGCSMGNAGVVGPGHVAPLASPETLAEGMRWIRRRHGALGISLGPGTLPWIGRFLLASTAARSQASARVLQSLALESAELHGRLAERLDTRLMRRGLLEVYESFAAFDSARRRSERSTHSVRILDGAAAGEACAQLAAAPAGAILGLDEAHCDPGRFVSSLAHEATRLGVSLRYGVEVIGMRRTGDRVASLVTTEGDLPVADLVVAAGAWSPAVVRGLPIAVPMQGGKGYHVELPAAKGDTELPTMFPEQRVVVTPLEGRLRISGMLQLAGTDMGVDTARVDVILAHARRLLRGLESRPVLQVWRGLRPCSPDGLPLIGRIPGAENAILATGHGMWGLQLAPVTARLVADLLMDAADRAVTYPVRVDRFRTLGALRLRRRPRERR